MCKQSVSEDIMQDQIAFRGRSFPKKTTKIKESPAARETEARRQTIARRKAEDQEIREWRLHLDKFKIFKSCQLEKTGKYLNENVKKSSAVHRNDYEVHRKAVAKNKALFQETRAMKFHLKTPKPQQIVQTNTYSKLYEPLLELSEPQTFGAQTEDIFTNSEVATVTTEACTQVDNNMEFDFDMEVTPIAETMIRDVLGQAINEMRYKDEVVATARHQRAMYLERTTAEVKMLGLEREDEKMRKTIAEHTKLFDDGEKNEKSRISKLPSSYGVDFRPRVDLDLNPNGSTIDTTAQAESSEFVSCLLKDLQAEKTKNITIEDFVENIQQDRKRTFF